MNDTLLSLLQWLIPSGGLGAVVLWLTNKTLRQVRTAKEMHDTYKVMYEDTKQTLVDIQYEKKELHKVISRLERAINRCFSCRYYDSCPAINELQKHKGGLGDRIAGLAPAIRKTNRFARDNPDEPGDPADTDGQPP